jgi:hypothetical protein
MENLTEAVDAEERLTGEEGEEKSCSLRKRQIHLQASV